MKILQDCLFCKMGCRESVVQKLYEDEGFFCIRDIHPQSKSHFLVIPKQHIESLESVFPENGPKKNDLIGKLFEFVTFVAREERMLPEGFRTVINTGKGGGQTVFHLHVHLLGGEPLGGAFGI